MNRGTLKTPAIAMSAKAKRTHEAPISALIAAAVADPRIISLAAGLVDPATLPVEECAQITRGLFANAKRGRAALQYDTTIGLRDLRNAVTQHIYRLEGKRPGSLGFGPENVIISTGSQQMLYLVGDVLLDVGDIVIAANPSYFVFAGTLQSLGARVLTVPMDKDGMDVEAVETLLNHLAGRGELPRVKFIYCTSFFDNPTGLTLSLARRKKLMDIARRFSISHRILILEDAAYRELRYDGETMPSIKSFDQGNQHVILTQTFSKPFAPGIKLGYSVLPRGLHDAVLRQKGNHDFGTSSLCQHIALQTMRDGSYAKHLEVLKRAYRKKRDTMLNALDELMPVSAGIHWTQPLGGLYVWLTLPEGLDSRREGEMFRRCIERGVIYVPGDYCFAPDEKGNVPHHHIRLSFGNVAPKKIRPGIDRLTDVIKDLLVFNRKSKIENRKSARSAA